MPMNAVPEPIEQRLEIAAFDLACQRPNGRSSLFKELHGEEIPKSISREVANESIRPMHVLENSLRVVGGNDTERCLHPRIPGLGQVGQGKPPFDKIALQLKAEQNVEIVGYLIGFYANQGWLYAVDRAIERF